MRKSPQTTDMVRYTIHYTGDVQGVGFRYTTSHLARRYSVAGYVQNLRDGRVCVVVEGEPAEIDGFLEAVNDKLSRHIHDRTIDRANATGEFGQPAAPDTFGIRY